MFYSAPPASSDQNPVGMAVNDFYDEVLKDKNLAPFFKDVDLKVLKAKQTIFLRSILEEGYEVNVDVIREIHSRMIPKPKEKEFRLILKYLEQSFEKYDFDPETIQIATNKLAPLVNAFKA